MSHYINRIVIALAAAGLGLWVPISVHGQQPSDAARAATVAVQTPLTPPADYVIGPDDVLGVLFWRDQDMSGDVLVRPDGMITLPLIGDLPAAGLKPGALGAHVQTAVAKYLTDPSVTVVVREIRSRQIFITGEVATPGAYPLIGPRTVMQAIALAGGLNEWADSKSITVVRSEGGVQKSYRFNYHDVARGRSLEQNLLLHPGDTIVVP